MEVRLLKETEWPLVLRLLAQGGPYVPSDSAAGEAAPLVREKQDWGLWLEAELVGWCQLAGRPPALWVARVIIAPAYRGQGCAALLLREVLTTLRRHRRYREVKAAVHPDNLAAIRLFRCLGFEASPYEAAIGEVIFRLTLA